MDQIIILVDDLDKFKGYTTWKEGHFGKGRRHRGFVVLLFDEDGNVYLQKRKHRVFNGLWDLTAVSHPYRLRGKGSKGDKVGRGRDESLEEAGLRSLKNEMGIGKVELKDIGAFVYFAKDGEWCENEYCHILVGRFDGKIKPNKKYVYDANKVAFEEFVSDLKKYPGKYTPWAREGAKIVGKVGGVREVRELEEDWGKFKAEFEKYYAEFFRKKIREVKKYQPIVGRFYGELEGFGRGGKRLRPYLVWLGWRLSRGSWDSMGSWGELKQVLPVCLAVELAHMGFMNHDDIMDRSDSRHGEPSMHKRFGKGYDPHYGLSQAILVGDLAFFEAFKLLEDKGQELLKVWVETCYGQGMDVKYAYTRATLKQIWHVYDLKTAGYSFAGPLLAGFAAGLEGVREVRGIGEVSRSRIEKYAMACGRSYQLRDDILGVFGEEKITGKSPLSDMREGKNTVLVLKAKELGGMKERQVIDRIWGKGVGGIREIGEVRGIIRSSGALKWCERELSKLVGEASRYVGQITKDRRLQEILRQLASFAAQRES